MGHADRSVAIMVLPAPVLSRLSAARSPRGETVVLLHGLARTEASLAAMEGALALHGYGVVNQGYPSRRQAIDVLAAHVGRALAAAPAGQPLHVVTHSMGGILLRVWLAANPQPNLGRVVMLAPPNQGSELVDALDGLAAFQWVMGPAGMQLGTRAASLPRTLPRVDFDLGVIAGARPANPGLAALIPGPNDGKVSVASTRVEGMQDHVVLPVSHTWMKMHPVVIAQVLSYLHRGRFAPAMSLRQAFRFVTRPDVEIRPAAAPG